MSNPSVNSGKILPHHLDRQAVVYVRQSTLQQVERHRESTRLQYGLVDRARQLGWSESRIVVIDDDMGLSGASAEGRPGFQRLVTQVGLDQVGMVLGIEMSRLARSSRDWYQLLEVCALFATLIGDVDGVYDPSHYNDRLLLGLKGTMSEAELHILKQRMHEGRRAKAKRGELGMRLPMGYVRHPSGEVLQEPDEQARDVVSLVFDTFERVGTINGLLQYLVKHQLRLPCRLASGARKGELEWRRPNRTTLSNALHHPIYAGAYVYGRRPTDPRRKQAGRPSTGRTVVKADACEVLIKDRFPAYISWAQYERNVEQMEKNTAKALGVVRRGASLLSGLIVCGRCGLRMSPQYTNNGHEPRYCCSRMAVDYGESLCQSLAGKFLDQHIAEQVLKALEPAALEVSLKVAENVEQERARHLKQWRQRLERAGYETERARRQYDAVEPENRLVARTLEQRWEAALAAQAQLQADYQRALASEPATLSAEERAAIRQLAFDIPALWTASTTTHADRQAIVRQLIERVLVTVIDDSEQVNVQIHWIGGHVSNAQVTRPVARLDQLSTYPALLERVKALHAQSKTAVEIAAVLNSEGWRPAKRRDTYTAEMVRPLLRRLGLTHASDKQSLAKQVRRRAHEWSIAELAHELDMPTVSLYKWVRDGLMPARQVKHNGLTLWLLRVDSRCIEKLKAKRAAQRRQGRRLSLTH